MSSTLRGWQRTLPVLLLLAAALVQAAGEEKKEGGEVEDKEQEEIGKAANAGMSIMLLGSVSCFMGLFYIVNHHDKDIVKYCWQVISSTISIFSAVLLFQGFNGIVEKTLLEGATEGFELFVSMAHFVLWFIILQVTLAYISGSLENFQWKHRLNPDEEEKVVEERRERRIKCYAVLLGHITGFAAINAFGVLQQQVPKTWLTTLVVAPLAWIIVYIFSQITNQIREAISTGDDGHVDTGEKLWDEETEETEDDVIGLAVSFVFVQSVRFMITGTLPNAEGEEAEDQMSSHSNLACLMLFVLGVALVAVEFFRTIYVKTTFERLTPQLRNITMMCFAWCFFFSMDWFLCHNFFVTQHGMIKQVTVALFISSFSFTAIFFLDTIADMDATGKEVDNAIRSVVRALGILIGFSWEKAFDTAVGSVSESAESVVPEQVTKMVMAILLAGLVVPAWRRHILPTVLKFEEEEKEEEEEEEAEEGADAEKGGERASEALEVGSNLQKPLLDKAKQSPAKNKVAGAEKKSEVSALRRQCKEYQGHIVALETRNAKLEASLNDFVKELSDLQKMADILKRSPSSPPRGAP